MRITCPYCGERDHAEFSYRGDAAPKRPHLRTRARNEIAPPPPDSDMIDYVYIRENKPGTMRELWQHTGGCRAWLVVERDVTSHVIGRVEPARVTSRREEVR
jgi:sarcosine oxidase subunit delta